MIDETPCGWYGVENNRFEGGTGKRVSAGGMDKQDHWPENYSNGRSNKKLNLGFHKVARQLHVSTEA